MDKIVLLFGIAFCCLALFVPLLPSPHRKPETMEPRVPTCPNEPNLEMPGIYLDHALVSLQISASELQPLMSCEDWANFGKVTIFSSEHNWIEASGSHQDGYCVILQANNLHGFAEPPPETLAEVSHLLTAFINSESLLETNFSQGQG